jgi:hypothetical protein
LGLGKIKVNLGVCVIHNIKVYKKIIHLLPHESPSLHNKILPRYDK